MKILLTGFEPFGAVKVNPSQQIVEYFAAQKDANLVTAVLPVEYAAAHEQVKNLLHEQEPQAIIMLGVAASRQKINLERIALNISDASLPDNAGVSRSGDYIMSDAPLAYESTLPLRDMLTQLENKNIPTRISNHAGAYLCNYVFYLARHVLIEMGRETVPCGFIHVPSTDAISLKQMIEAVEVCIEIVARNSP